jgi:hypothetical protein
VAIHGPPKLAKQVRSLIITRRAFRRDRWHDDALLELLDHVG